MSVLTDLIYGGSNAVAGLTEGAVNDAIAKYGADKEIAFPDTAYFFPTIYAATGVKVKTLGDLPACVGVLKSLITNQEDLGQALNAGLATAVGAEILEGLKFVEPKDAYEEATVPGIGFVPDPIIRSLGVPLVTGDIPGVAVVLGKDAKDVPAGQTKDYVFGYTILNDVSARDVQTAHKQWYFGKSLDGFTPIGPCIVTADEFEAYPPQLGIRSFVNGEKRQDSNTGLQIFDIDHVIAELSQGMTLKAGSIIASGTPAGVGMGMEPPCFLKPGDEVRCEIEGIGALTNTVR